MPLPTLIVVGGTCGSGKSTIAREVASRLHYEFMDGDDYHSEKNKAKMAMGVALNGFYTFPKPPPPQPSLLTNRTSLDEERFPWLNRLAHLAHNHKNLVIACSALKQMYREVLIRESERDPTECRIVMLQASRRELERRLDSRPAHFVKGDLLDSQLKALELPEDGRSEDEPYLRVINADSDADKVVGYILNSLMREE